jgi:hypothetical protein
MTVIDRQVVVALAPVREALLARARADADRIRVEGSASAARVLSAAGELADRILTDARREGEAAAATALAAERARIRRQARATVLAARREAYEHLRAQARTAVGELAREADLVAGLGAAVRAALGDGAQIVEVDSGGVVGEAGGRRLDCSLTGFADRAVTELFDELEDAS